MMRTVFMEKEQINRGNLILVNAQLPLKSFETAREEERELLLADEQFPKIRLRREAANTLKFILQKIGCTDQIVPVSGYRSRREQEEIFEDSLRENGEEFTRTYVALPGCSEHQTGLAIDLGLNQGEIDFIRPDFPYEGICDSFRRTAPQFGFIERYQESKEAVTKIGKEPWHFRYVGYPHSRIITEKNLALEEYTQYVKQFSDQNRLTIAEAGKQIEVYYVPCQGERTPILLEDSQLYEISGNNEDGFVVTVWREQDGRE